MSLFHRLINYTESRWGNPRLSLWRTVWINLRCLPLHQAIKLPVRVYGRICLANLDGCIQLPSKAKLRIGQNRAGYVNSAPGRIAVCRGGVWKVGTNVVISQGASILVHHDAVFEMGDYSTMGDSAKVICYSHIKVGRRCDLTWESQTMDFNSHLTEKVIGGGISQIIKNIEIGDYCWIGNRTTVMPGTRLPRRTIVASNSLLNKDYTTSVESCSLIGGMPARLLRTEIRRIYDLNRERLLINEQRAAMHHLRQTT